MNIFVMVFIILELVTFVEFYIFPLDAVFLLGEIFGLILRHLEKFQIMFLLSFVFMSIRHFLRYLVQLFLSLPDP